MFLVTAFKFGMHNKSKRITQTAITSLRLRGPPCFCLPQLCAVAVLGEPSLTRRPATAEHPVTPSGTRADRRAAAHRDRGATCYTSRDRQRRAGGGENRPAAATAAAATTASGGGGGGGGGSCRDGRRGRRAVHIERRSSTGPAASAGLR